MSAREFAEWMAFDRLEPIGRSRSDYAIAMLARLTLAVHAGKRASLPDMEEFLPTWERRSTGKTVEQQIAHVRERMQALGAKQP